MKERFLECAVCPGCRGRLRIGPDRADGIGGEIRSGTLDCGRCRVHYPIRDYIPRFVPADNYARSFGLEWTRHARTQLDKFNGTSITRDRFRQTTRWPDRLDGQRILEAGCGAGRFTEIALSTGGELISFDLSEAVDACLDNHGLIPSWHLFQGDLYRLPLGDALFDRVFCFGVLQHCPDPVAAFEALLPPLRPGGELAIDVYEKTGKVYLTPRFWLRLVTTPMPPEVSYAWVQRAVPRLLPLKTGLQRRVPGVGRYLAAMVPVISYDGVLPLSDSQLVEWAILDTFDMLSPRYENRASRNDVREWLRRAGLAHATVERAGTVIIGRGVKPAQAGGPAREPLGAEQRDRRAGAYAPADGA